MDKKGQVFTIDLLIAIFIFTLIFTSVVIFLFSIGAISSQYSSYYAQTISVSLNSIASSAINTLVGSQGTPINWSSAPCSSIKTVGIMYNYYEASPQKLYNLTTLPVACLSQLLRAGDSFNITTSYLNGTPLKVNGAVITAGFSIPQNPAYITSVQRFVVLYPGKDIIRMSFSEWLQ